MEVNIEEIQLTFLVLLFFFLSFLFFLSPVFFLVWLWYLAFFLICEGCYDDTVRYVSGSAVHGGGVEEWRRGGVKGRGGRG